MLVTLYEIAPLVYPANRSSVVTLRAVCPNKDFGNERYFVRVVPCEETPDALSDRCGEVYEVQAKEGILVFRHTFSNEQLYFIRVYQDAEQQTMLCQMQVYSLFEDLYRLRPYRGDLHIHSTGSDGWETPAFVAAHYRKGGFDFIAITDHLRREPSQEAMDAFKGLPIDLRLFHGEEIHPPENHIHMINFAGDESVNSMIRENPESYQKAVAEIAGKLDLPAGIDREKYASCLWVIEQTRRVNGLSIFCHPLWMVHGFHVNRQMAEFILDQEVFDAYEVCGGVSDRHCMLQAALYNDARARGKRVPVVASSDTHTVQPGTYLSYFPLRQTIVFSPNLERDSVVGAIKNEMSVGLLCPEKEDVRVYGSYRLSAYTVFLLEQYFPAHDELCFEEGRQMCRWLTEDGETAQAVLTQLHGRCRAYERRCFLPAGEETI